MLRFGAICISIQLILAQIFEEKNSFGPKICLKLEKCQVWPILATSPHLGQYGSGKWTKLVCLDVLSAVPTLFQPGP